MDSFSAVDLLTLIAAEIKRKGIAGHHINSMNNFTGAGLTDIITHVFHISNRYKNERKDEIEDADRDIAEYELDVAFTKVHVKPPHIVASRTGGTEPLMPATAIENGLTYSSELSVDVLVKITAFYTSGAKRERTATVKELKLSTMPAIVDGDLCNRLRMTREERKAFHEDPNDPGGYFIVNGGRWVINNLENISNNAFHVYKNMWKNEIARGQFISKPGDGFENSYIVLVRYMASGEITAEVSFEGQEKLTLPFYIIFRLLGIWRDKDIVNHIVYGVDYPDTIGMRGIIERGFTADYAKYRDLRYETSFEQLVDSLSDMIAATTVENMGNLKKDTNAVRYKANQFMLSLDRRFFPHIGDGEGARINKARFFGYLINKLLLVSLGAAESTDRDSYKNKRVAASGISEAKTFKTVFNLAIVMPIRKSFAREFKSSAFSKINIEEVLKRNLRVDELQKQLVGAITNGNKAKMNINKNEVVNRISAGMLYTKNDLNVISTLNTIDTPTTASKSTDRADEIRRVHPTFLGYVDVSQSADTGEKVGMNKQLACTAGITESTPMAAVRLVLENDPDVLPLDSVDPEQITAQNLAKIFVNGFWLGCCHSAHQLAKKYRGIRRMPDSPIAPTTSIVWEYSVRELWFWTDYGRLTRPLLIVYSNIEEYDAAQRSGAPIEFVQDVRLTREDIDGLRRRKITMDDLRARGVIEYISPDEQENCHISMNIDVLRHHRNDPLMIYTHCDIEQAIFGLVSMASPLANHSSGTRITYYTNHRKQATNWFCLNFPYRIDKHTAFQYYANRPLVRTFTDSLTNPNGQNCIVALAMYSGDNGEDSIIVNEASVSAGMFTVATFNFEKTDIERGESIGPIDATKTKNVKRDVDISWLEGGLIKDGSPLTKGTVMVSKMQKLPKATPPYTHIDKSLIYKKEEQAYVYGPPIQTRSTDDVQTVKIRWITHRPLVAGDKLSSRSGNKGIVARKMPRHDMPFTEDGIIPDLIVNGHSIPTRMAVNQILECLLGIRCVEEGAIVDATPFTPCDIDDVIKSLSSHGIKYGGHARMFNGMTGDWMDCRIFIGPTTYQRLAKFVIDEYYSIERGAIQPLTHQPMDGKTHDGGLRMGEMEKDVYCAHGIGHALWEKFAKDSDGTTVYICRRCGQRAVVNVAKNLVLCRNCRDSADICGVPCTWSASLFMNELNGMGVKLDYELEPIRFTAAEKK
jgi:DNA-directed RNA polymerase II subunit RPB2